jgi:ribosomal protein S20
MKVRKLVRKFYEAIFKGDKEEQKRLWEKSLKKSLKGKRTQVIK